MAEQCAAHLHVRVRALALLADDVVEVDLLLTIAEVQPPDIRTALVARELDGQLARRVAGAALHDRIAELRVLANMHLDATRVGGVHRRELNIDEMQLRPGGNIYGQVLRPALAVHVDHFILFPGVHLQRRMLQLARHVLRLQHLIDAQPAPRAHGNLGEDILCCIRGCHFLSSFNPSCLRARC